MNRKTSSGAVATAAAAKKKKRDRGKKCSSSSSPNENINLMINSNNFSIFTGNTGINNKEIDVSTTPLAQAPAADTTATAAAVVRRENDNIELKPLIRDDEADVEKALVI